MRHPLRPLVQGAHAIAAAVLPVVVLVVLAVSCTPLPPVPAPPRGAPADFPWHRYQPAPPTATKIFVIDGAASELTIKVYRAGLLRVLGHNHIIMSARLDGMVAMSDAGVGADLYVAAADLIVDDLEHRRALGRDFQAERSPADVAATRANMLGPRVLDATAFPFLRARLESTAITRGTATARVEFHLRGVVSHKTIDLTWHRDGHTLTSSTAFLLTHREFGLEPFGTLGGSIGVAEEIEIEVTILAAQVLFSVTRGNKR